MFLPSRSLQMRRREPRFPLSAPVTLTTFTEGMELSHVLTGITRDISRVGSLIVFSSSPPLQTGEFVELELHLPSTTLHCYGRVVRIREIEKENGSETQVHLHFTILEESSATYFQSLLATGIPSEGTGKDTMQNRGE